MAWATRPSSRGDFEIAVICALTIEANAVDALFDCHWDDERSYGKAPGDPNAYSVGCIGSHNIVLAYMPGMGKANAAAVAAGCRASFPNIKLALVVGICGAAPFLRGTGDEIVLGDVIISDGIVQYDLGQRLPERFVRKDTLSQSLARPSLEIRSLLAKLKSRRSRMKLRSKVATYVHKLQKLPDLKAEYPGAQHDRLFESTYRHLRDGMACEECGCSGELVSRSSFNQSSRQPSVHFGLIASGDTVMKAGEERDDIVQREGVVGFEMEGAGIWDIFPCVIIKGACDYADSHKTKGWQNYAAVTAAACAKAFLEDWVPSVTSDIHGATGIPVPPVPTFNPPWQAKSIETSRPRPTEPLSVAAFAMQIVDFGAKILSKAGESIGRGKTVDNKALADITKDLENSYDNLRKSLRPAHGSIYNPLINLANECQAVAFELLEALKKLPEAEDQSQWRSFRQAMLGIWQAEHIEAMERKLDIFRQQLILGMLETLRKQLRELYGQRMASEKSFDVEIGQSFLNRLQETELMQHELVKDIEGRLRQVIQTQHEAMQASEWMTSPDPPRQVFDRLKVRFLWTLKFSGMTNRRDRIPVATRNTFEWVYRVPEDGQIWSSFVDWLREKDGVYWVTGKPGSGKSTLMKFLQEDARTKQNLGQWSQGHPLTCASFYFWNSGTEIQMSNEGLTKSLLHQICETAPDLIPQIFPDRWEALNLFGATNEPWTTSELLGGLRTICTPEFSNRRFFFLIDGLDEFDGDESELIGLVEAMQACKHVKVCVSSRPWIQFQQAFGSNPNLRLEDLTLPDIRIYVETNFNASPGFSEIRRRSPTSAVDLFNEIADRSSGVFLWVHLVVKSLLRGISNGDKFSDLQKRLAELPRDLKALFQRILESIEPRYKSHASQLFHIHREHGSISLLRLAFADEDDDFLKANDEHTSLTTDEFFFRCEQMKNRVDSRTKGLLEVTKWSPVERSQRTLEVPAGLRYKWQVQYLHRTVRDFFSQPQIWSTLSESAPGFDPYLSLCRAFILEIKYLWSVDASTTILQQYINSAMMLASMADVRSRQTLIAHLDAANSIVASLQKKGSIALIPLDSLRTPQHAALFPIAIEFDLDFYVEHLLLKGHPVKSRKQFDPYISFGVEKQFPKTWYSGDVLCLKTIEVKDGYYPVSSQTLRLLVKNGATLYEKRNDEPYLKHLRLEFAETCCKVVSVIGGDVPLMERWLEVVELFISLGADPSFFWRILPERKVKELARLAPDLEVRLREVLKVTDDQPYSDSPANSPRLGALEKLKRRRIANLAAAAAKRTRR
ncbi:hypothetical protein FPRO04_01398 [Fusarium proliferatum]|nr:hypothetical protein FPRO04_01398 [Fusarium proliferatum]